MNGRPLPLIRRAMADRLQSARRNLRRAATSIVAAGITAGIGHSAFAQTANDVSPQDAQRALELRQNDLAGSDGKETNLQSDVADLDAERERLNIRLVETAALIQRSEAKLTAIEGRLLELEAQEKIVRGSLGQRHGQIATLLGALQRMGRNPPPVLITRREDALKMVRSAMLLSSAFPELKGQALKLTERLDDLIRVMGDIRSEGERLQAETDRLQESRTRLASLMEAKKLTIADRQQELIAVRAASAEITKNVSDLSELISRLDQAVTANVKNLGAYESEVKAKPTEQPPAQQVAAAALGRPIIISPDAPTGRPAPMPPTDAAVLAAPPGSTTATAISSAPPNATAAVGETQVAVLPPPRVTPQVIELAPSTASLLTASAGRIKPAIPFAMTRAKLPIPAQGRRALAFGERTQYGGQSKGLVIETRNGAQITSPCDGWIVYAGEFRSYGQLLIINAGDGYHILLAGLSGIDVQPGQFVLAAEPVGTMAGAASPASTTGQIGAPVLYVEFRKDGRPIDPDPWWASGQQKVQG